MSATTVSSAAEPVVVRRGGVVPGVVVAGLGAALAWVVGEAVAPLSPAIVAVMVGVVLTNTVGVPAAALPGVRFTSRTLLRAGIVLLGLRLAVGDVADVGAPALAVVAATVLVTFVSTQWLGRRLGLGEDLSLLVATGYSICGASAIAAVNGTVDADDDDVAISIGLVTVFGTAAMLLLPLLATTIGLAPDAAGMWLGASIHDVAQVIAAGSGLGAAAASTAVVVKLTRVVLLAPLVAGVSYQRGRDTTRTTGRRPPLLPGFVLGFLVAVGVRSTGMLGAGTLSLAGGLETGLILAALVALGAGVDLRRVRTLGLRPLVLGSVAWGVVALVSLGGVLVVSTP